MTSRNDNRRRSMSVALPQNVPAIDAEEIRVAGYRPPARRWVVEQLGQRDAPHLAGPFPDRPGVINHNRPAPIRNRLRHPGTLAHVNHRVIRLVGFELAIKKQIAGPRVAQIARYEMRVQRFESFRVSEFSERTRAS